MYKYLLSILTLSLLSLLYSVGHAGAVSELFNSDYSLPDVWLRYRSDNISFSSTSILLSSYSSRSYPYIRSSDVSDFSDRQSYYVRFRYTAAGGFGVGISFSDASPPLDTVMNYPSAFMQYAPIYIWQNNLPPYLHIVTSLCKHDVQCNGIPRVIYSTSTIDNDWHIFKIIKNSDNTYNFEFDNYLIDNVDIGSRNIRGIWLGNPETTQSSSSWSKLEIDEISANDLLINSFPYYSQLDPLWKDEIYDSGDDWNNPGEGTIGRWGCAITSVSMLLKKYGMNMPDGAEPTPSEINTWLKSQTDGYVGGGLLNWLAITRLAHSSYESGEVSSELEFVKSIGSPSDELSSGYYPIINTGKHFVIAYRENEQAYDINDPISKLITSLPKSTNIRSINTFIPSETNLAYILLVADPGLLINLPGSEYFDEELADEDSSKSITKRFYYLRQPDPATYKLTAKGEIGDQIEVYLYDRRGQVVSDIITLTENEPTSFMIEYDPDSQSNKVMVDSTPILAYLRALRIAKTPFNGIMQALYGKFVDYFAYINQGIETSTYAKDLVAFVNKQSPKHIPIDVKTMIHKYIRLIEIN